MELLREDPAMRYILIALIILAINVIILGEFYLLAVLLGGRERLRKLARAASGLYFLSIIGLTVAFFLLTPLTRVQWYEAPGPPSRTIAQVAAFNGLLSAYGAVGGIFYILARRLAGLRPKLSGPMPPIRYRRMLYVMSIILGIGLIVGLLLGALLGEDPPDILPLPLLHWPLAIPIFVFSLVFSLYIGFMAACARHIQWRLERLAPARFRSVGIWLMLAGSLVLGAAFWLVP